MSQMRGCVTLMLGDWKEVLLVFRIGSCVWETFVLAAKAFQGDQMPLIQTQSLRRGSFKTDEGRLNMKST
eukprot:3572924-Amphidinium_carterae.1